MTPQEAIEILRNNHCTNNEHCRDGCMYGENQCAYQMAISALEKQMPKKPIDIYTPVVTWGLCPICKGEFNKLGGKPNRVFKSNDFCPDCGQALCWDN